MVNHGKRLIVLLVKKSSKSLMFFQTEDGKKTCVCQLTGRLWDGADKFMLYFYYFIFKGIRELISFGCAWAKNQSKNVGKTKISISLALLFRF